MKKIITIGTLILFATFLSCNETKKVAAITSNEIASGKYEILDLYGKGLVHKLYFEIDASENRISGKTDCNGFGGNYVINKNEINIGPLISTKMYCEEAVMKVEDNIFKAFNETKKFTFDANMLTFIAEDGSVLIKAYKEVKADK